MSAEKFIQPLSWSDLMNALNDMRPGSKVIAGGTDLMIDLRKNGEEITDLVSLIRVPELKGIKKTDTETGPELHIGAMECHTDIAASPLVRENAGALADACSHVGSVQIRNRGTIGGSLANASVAGDMLPVLFLLHGSLVIAGAGGRERRIPAEELMNGTGGTSLAFNEIIKEIILPAVPGRKSCFVKLGGRKEVTIAEISLCFSWDEENGKITRPEGVMGAVDRLPVKLDETAEIFGNGRIGKEECDRLAESLSGRIRKIRENRKRPPRLRIREGEREFKERAVKGVVYDAAERMLGISAAAERP